MKSIYILRYAEKCMGVYLQKKMEFIRLIKATEEKRKQIRKDRLKRSVPTKEWMKAKERKY